MRLLIGHKDIYFSLHLLKNSVGVRTLQILLEFWQFLSEKKIYYAEQ
jgi:hypothetical protein